MNKTTAVALDRIFVHFRSRPLIWDTITTTMLSTMGKGAGFLIPFFIAAWFGVSADTDAFFFAYGLIIFFANIFSTVVENIIVPFISEIRMRGEDAGEFIGRILGVSGIVLIILSVLFLVLLKLLLPLISRFSSEGQDLIFLILVESLPLVVLLAWTGILSGTLNAYKVFGFTAISPALRAVVTLGIIYILKDEIGVQSIAIGYVFGEIFRLVILFYLSYKLNLFRIKLSVSSDKRVIDYLKHSFYLIGAMMFLAVNPTINKVMASWLGSSNVSILEYADRLYQIPWTFVYSGFIVVLLSHWADEYYKNDWDVFRRKVVRTGKIAGSGAFLISMILTLFSSPLVNIAYGHGDFKTEYIEPVNRVFLVYLIGFAPATIVMVYSQVFLICKKTKAFMLVGILNCILNIFWNLILIKPFGIYGLAWSMVITYTIISVVMYFYFYQMNHSTPEMVGLAEINERI